MRLIVDSDGGIDDAAALWWLCRNPDVDLVAVTAVGGSVPAAQAAINLRFILEAAGAGHVPVFSGRDQTAPAPRTQRPVMIHGYDGLADLERKPPIHPPEAGKSVLDAFDELCRAGTSVLALGPMTNLGAGITSGALRPDGATLTFMGGSARAGGNARPTAEANIAHDPSAADVVLRTSWATPPRMVGLDVTHRATLTEREFGDLAASRTPAAKFLAGRLAYYGRHAGMLCAPGETPCHDLLAAMVCTDPTFVDAEIVDLQVDIGGGAAWGTTVADLRPVARRAHVSASAGDGNALGEGAAVQVGLDADVDRFRATFRSFVTLPIAK
nr:nucleoside hydrolase [Actinomadura rugatobispora]